MATSSRASAAPVVPSLPATADPTPRPAGALATASQPHYSGTMADIFDVVADGTRRELLTHLLRRSGAGSGAGEIAVSELVTELGISQPTVSKHLKVLRDHGLVAVREEGQHRYYRLDSGPLGELAGWIGPFVSAQSRAGVTPVAGAADDTASPVYAAWAGTEVGDRMGRRAAETAHSARVALEAAQEKLQGAQKRVAARFPQLPFNE